MEFYLFILGVLFLTALADLVVGVSNDAVNFLNSAVGSKAASRRTIMIIAGLGVVVGTTFSSGMMEVARKGIFNPEYYTLHEVMIIFLAVMLTDILLLDLYNTFGLPTSTTVSIVFEIFGGAVAIAFTKVNSNGNGIAGVLAHINSANIVTIISGIGLSIVFAFFFGVIIQFITRWIFTFNYKKPFKRYGAIYCGLALATITYFILVKGAKGSSLISTENAKWIYDHILEIIGVSFIFWTVLWQFILLFTKINVLKIIVLIGTFALALAFAANDLVNFIGAPLGALSAFQIGKASGDFNPLTLTMEALRNPVRANTWILLLAGVVMVITLWISKKARTVTKTEVNLGRQDEGVERFESSVLARSIVRMGVALGGSLKKITPLSIQNTITKRIDPNQFKPQVFVDGEAPSFDLLRAAVNLMVASALVSFGTSLKLPLSTTFVTFMVAMSTSLADKAWGRESAVYRVTGVLTVIGGWFVTAFLAFSTCFLFSLFIFYVKLPAILILVAFGFYFYFRSARIHRAREEKFTRLEQKVLLKTGELDRVTNILREIGEFLNAIVDIIEQNINGLVNNQLKELKATRKQAKKLAADSNGIISDILNYLTAGTEDEKEFTARYAREIGGIQIINENLKSLTAENFQHINNNHKPPEAVQATELQTAFDLFKKILQSTAKALGERQFSRQEELMGLLQELKQSIQQYDKNQMKRIKKKASGARQSLLFISVLSKLERIAEQAVRLLQLY